MKINFDDLAKSKVLKKKNFVKTYGLWDAFFQEIRQLPNVNPENPNVQTLLSNIKLVVWCGYAEDFAELTYSKNNSCTGYAVKKFLSFFDRLSLKEKFYFNVSHRLSKVSTKANIIYKQLGDTGDEKLLRRLLMLRRDKEKILSESQKQIRLDYLNNNEDQINDEFKKRLSLFYALRSTLVHTAKPAYYVSTGSIRLYQGIDTKENNLFSSTVDFEIFFNIAIYRYADLTPPDISNLIIDFLYNESPNRFPVLNQQIINKIKQNKNE